MGPDITFERRMIDVATMFLVSALSMLLVIYVGFGEAQRTYHRFQVDKITAQGQILQTAMGSYLRAGLPLRQYVGFVSRAESILTSDSTITAISVFDPSGRPVFVGGDRNVPLLPADTATDWEDGRADLRQGEGVIQVVLALDNKFETVGYLTVSMPEHLIVERLEGGFKILLGVALALSLGFAWFSATAAQRLYDRRIPWLQIVYGVIFLAMSALVVANLVNLYSDGAQAKTKALADSLGQRIGDIVDYNLNIDEFEGLGRTLEEYGRLNPDISATGVIVDGKVIARTGAQAIGMPWVGDPQTYEYTVDLSHPENLRRVRVAVAVPTELVYRQVARSVKNFAALFVASAFLAGLFLQLARTVQGRRRVEASPPLDDSPGDAELRLVKPVFFVAVFVEHLTYSFLPQFVQGVVAEAGLSASAASAPFMLYYLFFALTLVPAGHYAQQLGARLLIYGGLILAGLGVFALALPVDLITIMVARAVSGIGQGMLFIGVQCYILAKASPHKKTQGAGIIVFGFQGGMISGTAIGSLLVIYMGIGGVFTLAAIIALLMSVYAMVFVPAAPREEVAKQDFLSNMRRLGSDLSRVLRDGEFLRTIFFIGIPAKAVMTGVVIFALPLLLAQKKFAQEDIGQVIMLYAIGVLVASSYVSRLVDRIGRTDAVLFWGAIISGGGLLLIALGGWQALGDMSAANISLIVGVITLGVAHGFINAPVVTHIAESALAEKIGANSVTATYRFLERVGHIAGPIIVGQLFLIFGLDEITVSWVGGVVIVLGILFILRHLVSTGAAVKPGMGSAGGQA